MHCGKYIARISRHSNRLISSLSTLILKKINFLLRNFISLQSVGLNRPAAARRANNSGEIENWPHHPENVISRNYSINLVTRNNTRDNITKTIREHSIHQARTIVALAGSNDFLANCFLDLLFGLLFLPLFSLSLFLSLYRSAILFFAFSFFFFSYSRPPSMRPPKVVGPSILKILSPNLSPSSRDNNKISQSSRLTTVSLND